MTEKIVQATYDLKDNITGKLKNIGDALSSNKAAAEKAAAGIEHANKRTSDSFADVAGGVTALHAALATIAGLVGLDKLKEGLLGILETGERFDDLEKQFATAFGGLDAGKKAIADIRDFAKGVPQSFEDVAAAAVKLRQFGLDPMDGSLQALIDSNNALDGTQDDLIATIDTLGKAYTKGGLTLKALVQLTEQGVPAFELLEKTTGKSADEIRDLADSGKLGQDSIRALVRALGDLRAGAAADEMGDLDAQFAKIKDSAQEFFAEIADAGVLDFFKGKLQEVIAKLEEMQKSGDLARFAKQVSDSIIAVADAVEGTTEFIVDHRKEIESMALAYATFRVGTFVANIAGATQAILQAATAARTASVATAGAAASSSLFARGLSAIVANPAILAIGAAATFTASKLIDLASALKENAEVNELVQQSENDAMSAKAELQSRIATLIDSNRQYADTLVLSGDEVNKLTSIEATAYEQRLERARQYYSALATQAKLAGDQVAFADAKEKLDGLRAALADVEAALAKIETASRNAIARFGEFATSEATKFDELTAKGAGAARAIEGVFKSLDLTTPKGLADADELLTNIGARGKEAGAAIRDELRQQILHMSDDDFVRFERAATTAFAASGDGAKDLKNAIAGINLQRLGVDIEAIRTGFTTAGGTAIETFRKATQEVSTLGLTADQQSQALAVAFAAAFGRASTSAELEALKAEIGKTFDLGKINAQEYAKEIEDINAKLATLATDQNLYKPPTQGMQQVAAAAQDAGQAIENVGQKAQGSAEEVKTGADFIGNAIRENRAEFEALGKGATQAFDDALIGISKLKVGFDTMRAGTQLFQAIAEAAQVTRDKIAAQRQTLDFVIAGLGEYGTAARASFELVGNNAERTVDQLEGEIDAIKEGRSQFDLLGQEDLGRLQSALEEARQRVQAVQQAAQEAKDQLADMAAGLQDELDRIHGNEQSIEDRRFQEDLKRIEEEAKVGGEAAQQQADRARKLAEELHEEKLRQIREQQQAQEDSDRHTQSSQSGHGGSGGGGSASGGGTGGNGGGTLGGDVNARVEFVHKFDGLPAGANAAAVERAVSEALARLGISEEGVAQMVVNQLQRAKARG